MSKKIFRAIWLVALAVFLASLVLIMSVLHSYYTRVQKQQLKIETQLAAQGVALNGADYLNGFDAKGCRITWIAPDGKVLYDNQADTDNMENHLEREEVREAIRLGYGESARYSSTLSEKQFYSAQRLPDGSVVRLSSAQSTVWMLLLGVAQPICIVVLLAFILSFLLASRLSKKIVEPINNIDLDAPLQYEDKAEYAEIRPLLHRMSAQQTQIKRTQAELEKTSQIRQEFTANASHELKTPLHAISGYAELIENGMVREEDIRPFAGKIRAESQRMTKLVEDIIDLTRLDGGASDLAREETDLSRIAENAVDTLRSTAEENGIALSFTGEPAPLKGIPQVLYSIVYNLCDNAVKYNYSGGHVEVSVKNLPASVRLTVSDTGIGIPEDCRDRIFERFFRVDKSHSKEVGGTGLGLSIVKHGAMIHHARVSIDSKLGQGTIFTIDFPKENKA